MKESTTKKQYMVSYSSEGNRLRVTELLPNNSTYHYIGSNVTNVAIVWACSQINAVQVAIQKEREINEHP